MRESISPWLDTTRLESWLSDKVAAGRPVAVTEVVRLTGGLSAETYRLTIQREGADPEPLILRRDPVGGLVERDIEREYRVMEQLAQSPLPVPQVLGLEMDPAWLERPFFVDRLEPGAADRNYFNSPACAPFRPRLGEQFIAHMATMHRLDIDAIGLDFLPRPDVATAAATEVAAWKDLIDRKGMEPDPVLAEAFQWLERNLPVAPRISLVHGEYRPGNFLFVDDRITGILDWEYAHLGDPLEDVGWAVVAGYRLGDLDAGFYCRAEFLERYEAAVGFPVDPDAVIFWEVFSNVKVMGIMATGLDAFHAKTMNAVLVNYGQAMNCAAEICRLIRL